MGMMDRDYYGEHWAEKVLGIKPKKPKAQSQSASRATPDSGRGPIYVNRWGSASRSIDHADPRLAAVYRQRRENLRTWRRIWFGVGAFGALFALGYFVSMLLAMLKR